MGVKVRMLGKWGTGTARGDHRSLTDFLANKVTNSCTCPCQMSQQISPGCYKDNDVKENCLSFHPENNRLSHFSLKCETVNQSHLLPY